MKIYIASRYRRREEMCEFSAYAQRNGIDVTSSWLLPPTEADWDSIMEKQWWGMEAKRDLEDIDKADVLVLFAEPPGLLFPSGGRLVEFGYALGIGKTTAVIGESENIFEALSSVTHYDTFEEFVDLFKPARLSAVQRTYNQEIKMTSAMESEIFDTNYYE